MRSVDAVVIGMGVGGERLATRLASAGMTLQAGRRVNEIAGRAEVVPDWPPVARRIRDDTDSWDDDVAVRRLVDSGATFVRGTARIVEANRVVVDGTPVETSTIVVATGSTPSVPPVQGLEDVLVHRPGSRDSLAHARVGCVDISETSRGNVHGPGASCARPSSTTRRSYAGSRPPWSAWADRPTNSDAGVHGRRHC